MKFLKNTKRAARGFTLVELVIVIAVIAILAALLVPTILGQAERARLSRAKSDVVNLAKAIARVRTDTANTTAACLTTLSNLTSATAPSGCGGSVTLLCSSTLSQPGYPCWNGPYFTNILNDPWDIPYQVTVDENSSSAVTVTSGGPNRNIATGSDDISYIQ